jgi:hypothetical protein
VSEAFWHGAALIGSIVGATWVLRSKLSDIEAKLEAHITRTIADVDAVKARVIKLEDARARRNKE